MIRQFVDEALLFLLPFLLFAGFLLLTRRRVMSADSWRGSAPWLVLAGLLLAASSLIYAGITAERNLGIYEPPRLENGKVIPGRFR